MRANRKNVPAGVRFWSIQGVNCPIRYVPIHRANPAIDMASPRTLVDTSPREHEHHGTDRHGTAEYIEQEENEQEEAGYSPGITEEEVNADQQEGDNHPRNSVIDQLLAADPVDDHKSKDGGQSVD